MAISAHLAFDEMSDQRQRHVKLIGEAASTSSAVVLGGDFNCQPGAALQHLERGSAFMKRLQRAELSNNTMTGLRADMESMVAIDHVYVSKELPVQKAITLAMPRNPWAGKVSRPAKVIGASDHIPVWVEVDCSHVC